MLYPTESARSMGGTGVTRGHLAGKVAGVLVSLVLVLGGGVSAFGLSIEGAGVLGNGLMLSLFSSSRTPPVTTVTPSAPAPTLDNEIPTNTSSSALPAPPQVVETPPVPAKAAVTPPAAPPAAPPALALALPPKAVAPVPTPPAVVVASQYVRQLVASVVSAPPNPTGAAPTSHEPMGAPLPLVAPAMEAPEPGARLLLGTGLLVLAGTCRRRRRTLASKHGILRHRGEGLGGHGASLV